MARKKKNLLKAQKEAAWRTNREDLLRYFDDCNFDPDNFCTIGMDQSTTSFGVVILDNERNIILQEAIIAKGSKIDNVDMRIRKMFKRMKEILNMHGEHIFFAAMEGYSYNSPNQAALSGEVGYSLRNMLFENDILYLIIPPLRVKKYAAALPKENAAIKADKNVMLKAVYKNYDFDTNISDIADAFMLAIIANDFVKYVSSLDEDGVSDLDGDVKKYQLETLQDLLVNGGLYIDTFYKEITKIDLPER